MRGAFVCLLALALVVAGGASSAVSAASPKKPDVVPDELIVGFNPGVSEGAQVDALAQAGATNKKAFKQIRARLVRGSEKKLTEVEKALANDPRVAYVEPNYVVTTSVVPNDPQFSSLWGMNNTGQTGGTADDDIDAPEAWDVETGSSNVVVAVIDTGVDFSHPDLAPQQWVNQGENCGSADPTIDCAQRSDGVDNDGDGYADDWRGWDFINRDNDPFDDNNHGTHVSGTIGAAGNNGVGVAGVNWNVKIMALKFLGANGSGSDADAISAILFAADHGARVANNSWGGAPANQALADAIEYGASRGMLFAAAAGNGDALGNGLNTDTQPQYPSSFDSAAIVAVAATDSNDNLASFSNYGVRSVDLAAPGVSILSTTPGNTYSTFSGTSMATPHVSGAAALVMAHYPGATLYGTKALLMSSVDPKASLSGRVASGGRLNVAKAVSCSATPEVVVSAPTNGFSAGLGDTVPIKVIGANCASPADLGNVTVTVNGSPVSLSTSSPDTALYTGSYTATTAGTQTVTASVRVGGSTATQTVTGTAAQNYSCVDVPDTWVDARPGGKVPGGASDSDDGFTALNITFPFTYYGQTYTVVNVSSNGFLAFGSTTGADAFGNTAIPNSGVPNGVSAAFWDDLNPASTGDVYAGVGGVAPNRVLYIEWFNVPHFNLGPSGTATFEVSLHESTGEILYHWLDTDFGDSRWDTGASATAGVERQDGVLGRQISYNQRLLTNDRAVSCAATTASPPSPPSITTTTLADATNTQSYNTSLTASGGTRPYTWSVQSGALPSGVTLNSSTGGLSGTPSDTTGTYTFTARVDDGASQNATKQLTIDLADPLSVTTTTLVGGTSGQSYSTSLASSGGKTPVGWSLASGSLPSGLTLDPSGAISGTPSAAGTSTFTVQARDSGTPARTATKTLSITVVDPLAITTTTMPDATVGTSYTQSVVATGGQSPYTWRLALGSEPLPPGLSLGDSSGTISGSPTTPGSFSFTVQVDDGTQTDTQTLSIEVADPLVVTTTSLAGGIVQQSYSASLASSGGKAPVGWSLVTGSLPAGLTLDPSGTISGTPTAAGTSTFAVQAGDAGTPQRTAQKSLSITVVGVLTITTSSLPGGIVGTGYSQTLAATGGKTPYTWSLASGSGPLPPGLTLDASAGTISGSPTTSGSYSFTAQVDDGAQTDTQALSIAVAAAPAPLTITTTSLPGASLGASYSTTLAATGGTPPYTWSVVSGSLPPALSLGAASGTISGTPTATGTYTFTVQVADGAQTGTQALSITVAAAVPSGATVLTGTLGGGSAADLATDDDTYYAVNSTTSGSRTTAWYGRFAAVPNTLMNLRVSYKGKNLRSCTQTVSIWRWTTSSWIQLDSRSVGTTEVAITNLAPTGTLETYVSGTTGTGELRVRVRCQTKTGSFVASGDLMTITYTG